jgi:hypothetical protein
MNQIPQLDFHPDAEALSAFAEQALPPAERAQVLGHIGGCGRCRQIVYLAQEAADEMEAPAWAPAPRPATEPNRWFGSWRLVWVPAAGLAALVAVAITLHHRPATQNADIAKATPQEFRAADSPTVRPMPSTEKSRAAALPVETKQAPAPARAESYTAPAETSATAAPPGATAANGGNFRLSSAQPNIAPPLAGGSGQAFTSQATPPEPNPETAVAAWQQEQQRAVDGLSNRAQAAAKATQMKMRSAADHMVASRAPSFGPTGAQIEATPSGSFHRDAAPAMAGLTGDWKAQPARLPSGLAPLSTAAAQHHMLAIDQAGTLFVSEDAGKGWVAVPRQWTGKAIQVRLWRTWSSNGAQQAQAVVNPEHGAGPVPPTPSAVFEMVNDAGLAWVSADGKTWKQQ